MRRVLLLAVVVLGLSAPAAGAATLIGPNEEAALPYQWWVDDFLVPTYAGRVAFSLEVQGCEYDRAVAGCAIDHPAQPAIHMRPGTRRSRIFTLAHELGHVFDWRVMSDIQRTRFLAINRIDQGWDEERGLRQAPAEVFADAYAFCALDRSPEFLRGAYRNERGLFYWGFGLESPWTQWAPQRWQFRRTCALIRG